MGGQERVALDLATGQRARGHTVMAVSLGEGTSGPLADEFRSHGIEIATRTKWPRKHGLDLSLPARLALLFRRAATDVVHTHNPQPLIYGAPGGKLAGCATVHTRHHGASGNDSTLRLTLRRWAGTLADSFVTVSEETASLARAERDVRPDKIAVIRNGIDLARFDPAHPHRDAVRKELGIPSDAFVVGTIGRVVSDKNHALLLSAMVPLCEAGAHLVIVGDGESLPALRAQADGSSVASRIHLLGTRTDAPRLFSAFDAFCMSSRTEGLPLVIMEAMASALPIVSTAVGGIPNVITDGYTGLLVPSEDAPRLGAALMRLRDEPALAARIAAAGHELALREYSADAMVERYLAIYTRLLAHRGPT